MNKKYVVREDHLNKDTPWSVELEDERGFKCIQSFIRREDAILFCNCSNILLKKDK